MCYVNSFANWKPSKSEAFRLIFIHLCHRSKLFLLNLLNISYGHEGKGTFLFSISPNKSEKKVGISQNGPTSLPLLLFLPEKDKRCLEIYCDKK